MTAIEQRYHAQKENYETMRAACLVQVARWVYSTGEIWCIEPDRTDVLKPESVLPGPEGALHAWGYDAAGRLVVIKDFETKSRYDGTTFQRIPTDQVIVEYFLQYEGSEMFLYRFLRCKLQMVWSAVKEQGRVVALDQYRTDGGSYLERYTWENGILKSSVMLNNKGQPHLEVVYSGPRGQWPMYSIRRDGSRRLMGQPLPKGVTVKTLLPVIHRRLVEAVPKVVRDAHITEPVYCVALAYDGEGNDVMPPCLGLGLESERQRWVREKGKEARSFIWNPAEFTHYEKDNTQIEDDELNEACEDLSQAMEERSSQAPAIKVLKQVAVDLSKLDWAGILNTTSDFVVYAVDFELGSLNKNLKETATPEQWQAWKKAGML